MWLFATSFLKHPGMLGSVIPSSRFLVERMLRPIDWQQARHVVEYGPGVGTMTKEILKRMADDAQLLVIELNADLVAYLQHQYDDPRLTVVHGSAADVDRYTRELGWDGMDYALSGVPFSTIPEAERRDIMETTRDTLRPGGEFIVFQFSKKSFEDLRGTFDDVNRNFEPRNFLPAHCYRCSSTVSAAEPEQRAVEA